MEGGGGIDKMQAVYVYLGGLLRGRQCSNIRADLRENT